MTKQHPPGGNGYVTFDEENNKCTKFLNHEHWDKQDRIRRFTREYEVLLQLNEEKVEGICQAIPDSFISDQIYGLHFEMVLIRGVPLDEYMGGFNNPKSLEPTTAENYFRQLLNIVDKCHQAGVMHRDIKPNNIMVTQENKIVLIDFGLSCVFNENLGMTNYDENITQESWSGFENALVRLPEFEIGNEGEVIKNLRDPRSDIALCVAVFYFMLKGKKVFIPWNRTHEPEFIDSLKYTYIIKKGIQYLIENRFSSIDDIIAILEDPSEDVTYYTKMGALEAEIKVDILDLKHKFCDILYSKHPKKGNEPRIVSDGIFTTQHTKAPSPLTWHINNVKGYVKIWNGVNNPIVFSETFLPNEDTKLKLRRIKLFFAIEVPKYSN